MIDFQGYSPRLCKIRIRGKFFNYSIVNVHAPTEDMSEAEKEEFYEALESVTQNIPKHDIRIVIGDLNAKIGQETQQTDDRKT